MVVVGGGFRSLIAAYSLANKGNSVCIIEKSNEIGGFFLPIKWENYNIDKGPQFFDSFDLKDWDRPELNKNKIFNEVKKIGNVSDEKFISYKPFKVPVTYKLPMIGIEKPVSNFTEKVKTLCNKNIIIPNPYSLTRKDALDNLRDLGIL